MDVTAGRSDWLSESVSAHSTAKAMQLQRPESWVQILPLPWMLGGSGHIRQLLRTYFCRMGILMAVRGLACGHLMPAPHLGAMSGPHKQRGRSGSQPPTPACTPSRELDGVPDMALFSSLPSLHAPGPRSKVTAYSPQSNCHLPKGEEHSAKTVCESPTGRAKQEATGGLLLGQPKT